MEEPRQAKEELLWLNTDASYRLESSDLYVLGLRPFAHAIAQEIAQYPEDIEKRRVVVFDSVDDMKANPTDVAVDMICFVLSMKSKLSFERVQEILNGIQKEEQQYFLLNRWALVILDVADPGKFTFELADVRKFADSLNLPIIYGHDSSDTKVLKIVAGRVCRLLSRAARGRGVSPMLDISAFPPQL